MKKSLMWIFTLLLSLSLITVFSFVGCNGAEEEAVEEAVEEEAEEEVVEEETAEEEATEAEDEVFTVGFVPRAFVSVYFVTMADAVEAAAAEKDDIDVQIVSPVDQQDVEGQIKIIEDLTQKNVDLLAVSVNDPNACVPSLLEAQEKGIPIIILDALTPLEGIDVLSLIGSDNETGGEAIAEHIVDILGGEGKMAILEGVPGQYANEFRLKGFYNVMDNHPDIEIVASQPADWDRSKAMNIMENIIESNPDIDLVWGVNDGMALGAVKALEDAGMLDDVVVCGYNGDEEAVEAVKDGKMESTILQQPGEIGRTVIKIAEMIKEGRIDEVESVIAIPIVLVTSENAEDYL